MNFFKPETTLSLIDQQIHAGTRDFIKYQGTAEHYQAVADGMKKTLARLKIMRDNEGAIPSVAPPL